MGIADWEAGTDPSLWVKLAKDRKRKLLISRHEVAVWSCGTDHGEMVKIPGYNVRSDS